MIDIASGEVEDRPLTPEQQEKNAAASNAAGWTAFKVRIACSQALIRHSRWRRAAGLQIAASASAEQRLQEMRDAPFS